jgi:type VI secretion system secreted protein VgrG
MNAPMTILQSLLMSDAHRLMKLVFPNNDGPKSAVFVENFEGTEKLNDSFSYKLKLISEDGHIELKDFMGKMLTVELEQAASSTPRYFNGYVTSARHAGSDGGLSTYELEVAPWVTLLKHRRDHYIFHNQTLVDTLGEIFADYGSFADFKFVLSSPGATETFRVQYSETDFNYFNRRCEEKGWYYWFEHRVDGHTLVVSDDSTQAPAMEPVHQVRFQGGKTVVEKVDFIDQWHGARTLQPSKVSLQSFDFKQPTFPLYSEQTTNRAQGNVLQTEVYEYTGALAFANLGQGSELAALRLEEFESQAKRFEGTGNYRGLTAGRYFELIEHFEHDQEEDVSNREFLVLSIKYHCCNNFLQKGVDATYRNAFTAMRRNVPFRPGRHNNSQPISAPGIQTATVVGPAGEEIYCDEYGRVKVQFHWDRAGQMDEKSSCWVRVSSPWAGTNYGGMQLPRIGQEVIVDFLNGSPDQPIIIGRTYNQGQMPPWDLPANKNQSGFYSKSIGGGYNNANVLRFDDTAGGEQLWLHAEKDQLTEVENDEEKWVGNDRKKTIDRDETSYIKRDRTETVDNNERITVHNNRDERVDVNETISVGNNRTEDVGINETISIGQNRNEKVGKNEDISIGKNRSKKIGSNEKDKIGKNWSIKVGKMKTETIGIANIENIGMARMSNIGMAYSLNVGMFMNTIVGGVQNEKVMKNKSVDVGNKFTIKAGDEIVLECGKSILALKKDGTVFLNGVELNISAAGKNTLIHGAKVFVNPGAEPKTYQASESADGEKSDKAGGGGGGGGGNSFAAGPGSGPSIQDMMKAYEQSKSGGIFGTLSQLAGMAQQVSGLVGMAKQVAGMFGKDKGKGGDTGATSTLAPVKPTPTPAPAPVQATRMAKPASAKPAPATFRGVPAISPQTPQAAVPNTAGYISDEELARHAQEAMFSPKAGGVGGIDSGATLAKAPKTTAEALPDNPVVKPNKLVDEVSLNAGSSNSLGQLSDNFKI